jgi:hypothetical protein
MRISLVYLLFLTIGIAGLSGCTSENKELKQDARRIASAMCNNLYAMKKLKMANPADSVGIKKIQAEVKEIQADMAILYTDFNTKYAEKAKTDEFNREFRKYLNESMLDCKSLSTEEREMFSRSLK